MTRPWIKTGTDSSVSATATDDVVSHTVTQADGKIILTHIGMTCFSGNLDKIQVNVGDGRVYHEIDAPSGRNCLYPYGMLTAKVRVPLPVPIECFVGETIKIQAKADATGITDRIDAFGMGTKEAPGAKSRDAGPKNKMWVKTGTDSDGIANAYDDIVSHTVTPQTGAITIEAVGLDGVANCEYGRLVVGDETIVEFHVNAATSSFFPIPEDDNAGIQKLPVPVKADIGETIKLQMKSGGTKFSAEVTGFILGWQEVA